MTTKTTAKISININVNSLEAEAHINNKLCDQDVEPEGNTNGNIDTAAVIITPATVNAEKKKCKTTTISFLLENAAFNNAATTANAGKSKELAFH